AARFPDLVAVGSGDETLADCRVEWQFVTDRGNRLTNSPSTVVERAGGLCLGGPPAVVTGDPNRMVETLADVVGCHDIVDLARREALSVTEQHGVGGAGG